MQSDRHLSSVVQWSFFRSQVSTFLKIRLRISRNVTTLSQKYRMLVSHFKCLYDILVVVNSAEGAS